MSDLTDEAANEILQNAEWCKFSDAREMIQEVYAMGYAHAAAVLAAERITAAHWQSLAEANMALAVSANKRMAAKDAEIAGLRADNTRLQNDVVMPLRERVKVLEAMLTEAESALRVAEQEFADMPTWSNVGHAAKKVTHALAVIAALGIGGGGK